MAIIRWSRILMASAGLVAVACSALGQPDRGSELVTHLPAGVVTRASAIEPAWSRCATLTKHQHERCRAGLRWPRGLLSQ